MHWSLKALYAGNFASGMPSLLATQPPKSTGPCRRSLSGCETPTAQPSLLNSPTSIHGTILSPSPFPKLAADGCKCPQVLFDGFAERSSGG